MCRHSIHRHPLHCVVPPYILDRLIERGTPDERHVALRTKATDATFRTLRATTVKAQYEGFSNLMSGVSFERKRTIYNADGSKTLPGTLVRSEGDAPTGDAATDEAYDGLGATYDFYEQVLNRHSIDDAGMELYATVHFGRKYNNAFWDSRQMVFGDGDGKVFNRMTIALEVIGHELAHGVTQNEANLKYAGQPGALNESLSDVFGALIKQYKLQQTAEQADWLMGQGLLMPGINGIALRSMKEPGKAFDDKLLGKDPQPKHMDNFVETFADNFGVHINSGIPNHAFYQVAVMIGGFAWEKAGRIWYDALGDSGMRPLTGFARFARLTHDAAGKRYGIESVEQKAVREGWAMVGINATID